MVPKKLKFTGEELRDARVKLGYTQEEIAELLGIHYRTVGRWELGRTRIPYSVIMLLNTLSPKSPNSKSGNVLRASVRWNQ